MEKIILWVLYKLDKVADIIIDCASWFFTNVNKALDLILDWDDES